MFAKAKLKRFNEEVGCAPPPTAYNPKLKENIPAATLDKSQRWKHNKEDTPGPGAYSAENISPIKKRSTSSSRLNSSSLSTCSTASSSSNALFLSPPRPKPHIRAPMRVSRGQTKDSNSAAELQEKIKELIEERNKMRIRITELEEQLKTLRSSRDTQDIAVLVDAAAELCLHDHKREWNIEELGAERLTVVPDDLDSVFTNSSPHTEEDKPCNLKDNQCEGEALNEHQSNVDVVDPKQLVSVGDDCSGLNIKQDHLKASAENQSLSENDVQILRETIDHLTQLRDNLEASILIKDDLIAELQVQLDEVVVEGRGYQEKMESYKCKTEQLEEEIENSFKERNEAEGKVRSLVCKYEALMKDQMKEKEKHLELLAKKDIEIELLNGSLNKLNMKITEYEQTLSSLQDEASQQRSKISLLESTVFDLSMNTKEKVIGSMLEEELNHRTEEVSKLEETISEVKSKLSEVQEEKDTLAANLEAEKKKTEELNERICQLEMQIKEKEVVQQFLEKEIASREAEVSESSTKIAELENDLETARQVALDLQQDAEAQLNQVLTLKATISAKDYDLDAKGELIATLQDEISQKANETTILQEKWETQSLTTSKMDELLKVKELEISDLTKETSVLKSTLSSCEKSLASLNVKTSQLEDCNHRLEEKVVNLMAEISDREAQHISKVNRIESDLDDLGVKYSEALLDHEATRRVLTQTSEQLEKENLLRLASEADVQSLKEELAKYQEENKTMESNLKDLVQKYTNLEDALACEEAENRDLEDRLEREMKQAQEAAAAAEEQLSTLLTSNNGFCTQITQLKIDMRKKSQAVEEMQQCIEALREEKQHLTTLRDNLERTVETKDKTIDQLHLKSSTLEREMEEERVTLRSRIADLENHLKEAEDTVNNDVKVVNDLEDKISVLEAEKEEIRKSYEKQLEEKSSFVMQVTTKLDELKKKYEGNEDQLDNLQTSLLEKTAEAEDLQKKCENVTQTLDLIKEEISTLETSKNILKAELDDTSSTLAEKEAMLKSQDQTVATQSENIKSLNKKLEEKQLALVDCEKRLLNYDDLEKRLVKQNEEAAKSISTLQEALESTKNTLSRLEITYSEEKTAEVSRMTQSLEAVIQDLRNTNASLLEELNSWKDKFLHLENMIEPFREQLDAYEVEKAMLLERNSAAIDEAEKLSKQYATLLGHQNHKQKIQHVLKLKTENSQLKEEVYKLRQETERQRKNVRRLEEKIAKLCGSSRLNDTTRFLSDKENSFNVTANPSMSSTPLKPSHKPHRF